MHDAQRGGGLSGVIDRNIPQHRAGSCAEANPRSEPYRVSGAAIIQPIVSGPISWTRIRTLTTSKPSPMSTMSGAPYRAARWRATAPEKNAPIAMADSAKPTAEIASATGTGEIGAISDHVQPKMLNEDWGPASLGRGPR